MSVDKTMADVFHELEAAMEAHKSAERKESAARSELTEATNRLNAAQKAVDKFVEQVKSKAPWNSDWHSQRNRGQSVEAR